MKKFILVLLLTIPTLIFSQTSERYPMFKECENESVENQEKCFYQQANTYFFKEFKVPEVLEKENFNKTINVLFYVDEKGAFNSLLVNSPYKELKTEVNRVFAKMPSVKAATYNNHTVEMRFVLPITFPLSNNPSEIKIHEEPKLDINVVVAQQKLADSTFLEHNSQLNIPFTHQSYVDYEYALHKNKGMHTASKPYIYNEINQVYDFEKEKTPFLKPEKKSWFGRKLWNEHLLQVKKEDYWLTLDFLVDVQLGKDNSDSQKYTYNNTRLMKIDGGLGDKFSFSTTIYESQGRFAEYINLFASNPDKETFKPVSSEGLVPGRGKAKEFGTGYDYPVAEGYMSYTPNKFLNVQLGHGKNFIGDGYRSFLLSDVSSPATYLKMDVSFWKFKYTNIWMWAQDVREFAANENGRAHLRKYIAMHYLSINVTDKFNLGFFEAAVSAGENGIDMSFFNPLMFYRSVEFNRGEDVGNALIGITSKYKFSDKFMGYSQLIIDEFSFGNLTNLSDWRNKFGLQLGAKWFDALNVKNLFLQGEFNYARPYTFAHQNPVLNYGHYSQPIGHLWGANFWEMIGIARYKKDRWSGYGKLILGKRGFDKDGTVSYGGNIYQSYDIRVSDTNNSIGQGNTATIFMFDAQGNYLLNPSNKLSLFAGLSFRKFSPETPTATFKADTNIWFTVGLRADLFNWYFDF
ncbi:MULTISPECIES: gliding motility protein RemB [Tenacibaculum]|uniref:gliding motility protein RemB n=1 Tax=Tenacibaculum TaxID=104267 RepID=UPI001F0A13A6|nr:MULTISPECIES: gliding motility protein RemB [Tenacibaculum]MCH3881078.1 gliding motility protein RemB [Tenacibaculum aquimarinum]MDO6599322.1 gliding motility protein RemB [Tenacibaculum sp. 1_MG-2023]